MLLSYDAVTTSSLTERVTQISAAVFDAVGDAIKTLDECLGGNATACDMLGPDPLEELEVHNLSAAQIEISYARHN
eukprot:1389744-Amorphochlora_amoeboformis.AAC.2